MSRSDGLGGAGRAVALLLLACAAPACGGNRSGPQMPFPTYGTILTVSPVPVAGITFIEPLGHLNPVGHVLPTSHAYLYYNWTGPTPPPVSPNPVYPVVAPGPGQVTAIIQPVGTDYKIWVQMNPDVTWILDHVELDPSIHVGDVLAAGQVLGTTNPLSPSIDLGLDDAQVSQPFVNPARYNPETLHANSPFKYFTPALQSQLYPLVQRVGPDKDSAICFDVAGALSGNWFEQSVPADAGSDGPAGWPNSIAFAPDNADPSMPCVSIGGPVALVGKWTVAPGTPAFASITPAGGAVGIQLLYLQGGTVAGLMMVQMTDASTATIEVFAGSAATSLPFTAAAHVYKR